MKKMKKIFTAAVIASFAGFAFADEWDDFDMESSAEPAIAISGEAQVAGRVYTDQRKDGKSGDFYSAGDMKTDAKYSGKLNFAYSGASSDAEIKIKLDNNSLGEYKADILDELTARAYMGNFQLEAGKIKTVWGKTDKIHVVDNFNANDYTDFIFPDYIDRRIAEPMFHVIYSTPSNVKLEGVWTPVMTRDRLASEGIWQPAKSKELTETVTEIMMHNIKATDDVAGGLLKASKFSSDNLVEDDIHSLKYGQAGVRTTFTVAGFDLGASYYYGHLKQPSVNLEKFSTQVASYAVKWQTEKGAALMAAMAKQKTDPSSLTDDEKKLLASGAELKADPVAFALKAEANKDTVFALPSLNYDQVQVFGLEGACVLWKFNVRAEGAYYLTEDTAGDNPWIANNSIQWVCGFDMDMPWTNMNINLQTQGKYILNNDKIKNGAFAKYDVDYNSDDKYISNKIIVDVTDSYMHDTFKIDVKGIMEVETLDFVLMPSFTVKGADCFSVTASGMWVKSDNKNSEFYNFRRTSFGQISCKYMF